MNKLHKKQKLHITPDTIQDFTEMLNQIKKIFATIQVQEELIRELEGVQYIDDRDHLIELYQEMGKHIHGFLEKYKEAYFFE